jgi:hypothetical protein
VSARPGGPAAARQVTAALQIIRHPFLQMKMVVHYISSTHSLHEGSSACRSPADLKKRKPFAAVANDSNGCRPARPPAKVQHHEAQEKNKAKEKKRSLLLICCK